VLSGQPQTQLTPRDRLRPQRCRALPPICGQDPSAFVGSGTPI